MKVKTFLEQCVDDIIDLNKITKQLIKQSSIGVFRNNPSDNILVVAPEYHWNKLLPEGEATQSKAITLFNEVFSRLDLLFDEKPKTVIERYEKSKDFFSRVIKREKGGWDWSVPATTEKVEKELEQETKKMKDLFTWLKSLGKDEVVLIPDTNALIINRNIPSYGEKIEDVTVFTVIITSSVLRELDELKYKGNNNELKEKVKKVINYIKGLRNQGDVIKGIKIENNRITFKLQPIEPDMENTLPWLDSNNIDDRIIASCFYLQIQNPASSVILLTADINLQAKAAMARLAFIEPTAC